MTPPKLRKVCYKFLGQCLRESNMKGFIFEVPSCVVKEVNLLYPGGEDDNYVEIQKAFQSGRRGSTGGDEE